MDSPWQVVGVGMDRLAALPHRHPRRIGLHLMTAGVVIMCVLLPIRLQGVYAGLGLAVVGALLAAPPLHRLPGFWWAAWFGVLQVATDLATPWDYGTGGAALTWLATYLAAAVLVLPGGRRAALVALGVGTAVAVALALAQFVVGYAPFDKPLRLAEWGDAFGRVGSFHGPPTWGNIMVGVTLIFCGAAATATGTPGRRRRLELIALAAVGMGLSVLRMAYLAMLAALAAWGVLRGGRRARRLVWIVPLAAVLALGGLALLDHERFLRTFAGTDGRWPIWRAGAGIILDHPWLGAGTEQGFYMAFRDAHPPDHLMEFGYRGYFNLHNSYLTLWAQHGIVTLLAWLGWLGACLVALRRRHRARGTAWPFGGAVVAAILCLACFDHFAGRPAYHLPLYVALGLALALGIAEDRAAPEGGTDGPDPDPVDRPGG